LYVDDGSGVFYRSCFEGFVFIVKSIKTLYKYETYIPTRYISTNQKQLFV